MSAETVFGPPRGVVLSKLIALDEARGVAMLDAKARANPDYAASDIYRLGRAARERHIARLLGVTAVSVPRAGVKSSRRVHEDDGA